MKFIVEKERLCPCGCGNPCKLVYNKFGRFKGYSPKSPNCPNKFQRPNGINMPDRVPVGTRRIDNCGRGEYWIVKIPGKNKWEREHRYIARTQIRPLLPGEHVHHINGNTLDNRLENLAIMDGKAHLLHHIPKLGRKWALKFDRCIDCKKTNRKHLCKGRCTACHQKLYRSLHVEKFRAYDRVRQPHRNLVRRQLRKRKAQVGIVVS